MGIFKRNSASPIQDMDVCMPETKPQLFGLDGGVCEDDTCGRNGCEGKITPEYSDSSCSCHFMPPCSYCVNRQYYCDQCDWTSEGEDDFDEAKKVIVEKTSEESNIFLDHMKAIAESKRQFQQNYNDSEFIAEKIMWKVKSCGYASMVKYGMMPKGTPTCDIVAEVRGSFGGKFISLSDTRFEYIAYTD